jgi:hypothetical protein
MRGRAWSNADHRRPAPGRAALAAVAVAGLLGVAGCGGGDDATASGDGKEGANLPGVREFGLNDKDFATHIEKTQALIATCMKEAGFEYVPVDVKTVEAAQARVRQDPGLTRKQYKEKYGLAVTTRFDNPVRETGFGPHNQRIYDALSETDKAAYDRTLYGENKQADFVFTLDEEDFSSTGGCTRKAVEKVFTPAQVNGTFVNPKDVLVDSDKRVADARRKWSECMKSQGYDYLRDQDEIIEDYEVRLADLTEGDDPATLTGERAAALKKMQAEEIKVSLADLDCQLKHTEEVYNQVEREVYGHELK